MATATDLLRVYRDQTGSDADEAMELLVDFLTVHGMSESALTVLCEHIDEEAMTDDLAGQLRENGLVVDDIALTENRPGNSDRR